jgi:hypothetical protein
LLFQISRDRFQIGSTGSEEEIKYNLDVATGTSRYRMPPRKALKHWREAAARGRFRELENATTSGSGTMMLSPESPLQSPSPPGAPSPIFVDSDSEAECRYQGGINHYITSDDGTDSESEDGRDAGYETVSEFGEDEITEMREKADLYTQIQFPKTAKHWKKVEANQRLGYSGHSARTGQQHAKEARERQEQRNETKNS